MNTVYQFTQFQRAKIKICLIAEKTDALCFRQTLPRFHTHVSSMLFTGDESRFTRLWWWTRHKAVVGLEAERHCIKMIYLTLPDS